MAANSEAVREFVVRQIKSMALRKGRPVDQPDDEFGLVESGLFDSLDFVELVSAIEREFDAEIDFGELDPEEFMTVGGVVKSSVRLMVCDRAVEI